MSTTFRTNTLSDCSIIREKTVIHDCFTVHTGIFYVVLSLLATLGLVGKTPGSVPGVPEAGLLTSQPIFTHDHKQQHCSGEEPTVPREERSTSPTILHLLDLLLLRPSNYCSPVTMRPIFLEPNRE
uniref:Uncharacterized protein n=1 Tax=Cynoglossus semilaevis TaxID=244447 RepID=A0A3P8WIX4_CYNSE